MVVKLGARARPSRQASLQVIEIVVADGYHPDLFEAREGVSIRVVFRRRDDDRCTDRVVFSQPRLERHLSPHATTIVDLPPVYGDELRFTCGMGRYRGRINLAHAPGQVGDRITGSLGAGLVFAFAGLAGVLAR
jgi:plastocyanin domain-containing protein